MTPHDLRQIRSSAAWKLNNGLGTTAAQPYRTIVKVCDYALALEKQLSLLTQ